jgi:hypothetical protein
VYLAHLPNGSAHDGPMTLRHWLDSNAPQLAS